MVRTNEGGSVLGFIVIGVVLVGLLLGGAYFLSRQGAQLSGDTQSSPKSEEKSPQDNKDSSKSEGSNQASGNNSQGSSKQAQQPPAGSSQPSAPSGELPQTGPGDTMRAMLAVGLLSAVAISYLRSRRQIRLFDLR